MVRQGLGLGLGLGLGPGLGLAPHLGLGLGRGPGLGVAPHLRRERSAQRRHLRVDGVVRLHRAERSVVQGTHEEGLGAVVEVLRLVRVRG